MLFEFTSRTMQGNILGGRGVGKELREKLYPEALGDEE